MASPCIGTHSGTFHCDEALACFMLKSLPEYKDATIVRSRDPKVLGQLPILVDVGGVYDSSKHRYDHHQRGFDEVFGHGFKTKLSSAGLVYKHFGKRVISAISGISDEKVIDTLFLKVYDGFIQEIDGIDNGVAVKDGEQAPNYRISTDLSSRVGYLNPGWNEDASDIEQRFHKAVAMTGKELTDRILSYKNHWLPARDLVTKAIATRHAVHKSGSVVLFEKFCSWKSHLHKIEQELKLEVGKAPPSILYVLYPDSSGKWRIQCVPMREGSFESRLALPEPWRGVRGEELSKLTGIDGCVFTHAAGFIGGNNTQEGALAMASSSLDFYAKTSAAAGGDNEPSSKKLKTSEN